MKRHSVSISSESKMMLNQIRQKLGSPTLSYSAVNEMIIRSAFDNLNEGNCFEEILNPTQRKLDEVLNILHRIESEI